MAKVLFIQLKGFEESLGIASLAACLEKAGHEAGLILASHSRDLVSDIKFYNPDIIGFSVITGTHREITDLGRFIKTRVDIPMIIGGPHATFYADDVSTDGVMDYICRGEGEKALLELADRLDNGGDVRTIPNLWVHAKEGWIRNEMGPLIDPLDSLPLPKREIYYRYAFLRDMPVKRFMATTGCPYSCAYCHNTILKRECQGKGRFVRHKSVERVIDEILYVKRHASLKRVHFSDELFATDKRWLGEFSRLFPRKVGIPFSSNSRLDCAPETIALLAEAGCVGVVTGFECGSEFIRRRYLRKFWTNEQAMKTVRLFKKYHITVVSNNILALPGETVDDAVSTVEWNARIGFNYLRACVFIPFPKLDIVSLAQEDNLMARGFSLKDLESQYGQPLFRTKHANEFINLSSLFYIAVKFKFLRTIVLKYLIRMKPNRIFDLIGGILNLYQHYSFFSMRPLSAWRYFTNTLGISKGFYWSDWTRWQQKPVKMRMPDGA